VSDQSSFVDVVNDHDLLPLYEKMKVDDDFLINVRNNIEFNQKPIQYYHHFLKDLRLIHINQRGQTSEEIVKREKELKHIRYFQDKGYRLDTTKKSSNRSHSIKATKISTVENQFTQINDCNSLMLFNSFEKLKIKEYVKTNLCKDKFCNNCKKVKQASRMARFIPEIEKVSERSNLYHLTLTVPNVSDYELNPMIKKMFQKFATLIEYLKGKKKIRNVDFDYLDYQGAIRSLEVTYKGNSYHPHLHVLIALDHLFVPEDKSNVNAFSYSYGQLRNKFTDFEILIQKIWYCLINDKTVNLRNIESEKNPGYSCNMDLFKDDDYRELFKYMTKGNGKDDETKEDSFLTYENFVTLYYSLKGVRQIQGYGCFFRLDDIDLEDEVDEKYDAIINLLLWLDDPVVQVHKPADLIFDNEYTILTRKRIYHYLRDAYEDDAQDQESL
jgi:plasmid rolling circle replication initiator protein Rep